MMDKLFMFVFMVNNVICFNVDVKNTVTFTGPRNSLFGYNGILLHDNWFIVSAPKANITGHQEIISPGVVYRCRLNVTNKINSGCEQIPIWTTDSTYGHAQTNQFLGGSLVECRDKIVTCAHLWQELDALPHHNYALGRCHQIDKNLHDVNSDRVFHFNSFSTLANAMVGFSAVTSKDTTEAVLGSPGIGYLGGFVNYPEQGLTFDIYAAAANDITRSFHAQSYLGYSVAVGDFDNDNLCTEGPVILGIPRFVTLDGHIGSVVIVCDSKSNTNKDMFVLKQLFGDEIGSGFGHSVVVADYNGDGQEDLIVSAPFRTSGHKVDVGRVYVFRGTGNSDILVPMNDTLSGDDIEFGRFGLTMVNLGDITADGIDDIAIACPYEDSGVVYIFNGMPNAINMIHSQKILGKDVMPGIQAFGLSISQPRDIDLNGFPDFAIGSPSSDKITVLKSRPVVIVTPTFSVTPSVVPLNSSGLHCSKDDDTNPCTTIQVCFSFSGLGLDKVNLIELTYRIYIDIERLTRRMPSRLQIEYGTAVVKDKLERKNFIVKKGIKSCEPIVLRVGLANRQFFVSLEENITMIMNYSLTGDSTQITPVVSPTSLQAIYSQASFQTGCFGICTPDLKISTRFAPRSVILGQTNQIELFVTLINTDDPAFAPSVTLSYTNNTRYLTFKTLLEDGSIMVTCTDGEDNSTVHCTCGNQLLQHQIASFRLLFSVSRSSLQQHQENTSIILPSVDFYASATIQSGLDDNHANNEDYISVPVEFRSRLEINGNSVPEQASLSSESGKLDITHSYDIYNVGPSPMTVSGLKIYLPIYYQTHSILTPETVQVSANFENANCSVLSRNDINSTSNSQILPSGAKQDEITYIDCPNRNRDACVLISCTLYDLDVDESAKIKVRFETDTSKLNFEKVSSYHYITTANIFPVETDTTFQLLSNASGQVTTEFFPDKPNAKNVKPINIWIIVGAVIGGVLLLGLLGFGMYKCGFFKREKKKQVEDFKRKSNYYENRKTQRLEAARSKAMSKVMSRSDEVILHHK